MAVLTKSKVFLYSLTAFIAGVAVRSFVFVPQPVIWVLFLFGAALLVIGLFRMKRETLIYGLLALMFFSGILRLDANERQRPDLSLFYGKGLVLSGYVSEDPKRTPLSQHLKIWIETVEGEKSFPSFFIRVTTRRYPEYQIGDQLELRGTFEKPENLAAPAGRRSEERASLPAGASPNEIGRGEFDYVAYLARENIYATISFPIIEKIGEWKGSKLKIILSRIKHAFEENLDRVLPEPHGAFLKGLTLGERESIPPELTENFKRTGVTHIIALSGYNITLVAGFFISTLLSLTVPFRVAFWIALLGVSFFVILTGASPSVVRAGVMGILLLIAQKEGRMYRITNALVFAGALMIFHNPKILRFDAAFQLSFLATLGLIFFSPRIDEKLRHAWHAFRRFLGFAEGSYIFEKDYNPRFTLFPFRRVLSETLSAQLMVLPLLIYLFGRVSVVSPLSNLLVILAVPPSMAVGFLTGALGFVWEPLAQASAVLNWALLEYEIRVIEFFAGFPVASFELGKWFALPLGAFYAILFIRLWLKSRKT